MASLNVTTRLYGNYLSQPSRAVLWAAAIKKLPIEMKKINPVAFEAETPEFLEKFPAGFIPALEVIDNVTNTPIIRITEGPAILSFLSEAHGWEDFYPSLTKTNDNDKLKSMVKRAEIQQWMHWAQSSLRPIATTRQFRPLMLKKMRDMGLETYQTPQAASEASQKVSQPTIRRQHPLSDSQKAEKRAIDAAADERGWRDAMLTMTHGALKKRAFLASTESEGPTIADLSLYCEIDQLYYVGQQLASSTARGTPEKVVMKMSSTIFDFKQWPEVSAWIERMHRIPEHDNVRRTMYKFLKM